MSWAAADEPYDLRDRSPRWIRVLKGTIELTQEHLMYDESIQLIELPDDDSISVCVYCENEDLFALGERINARFEAAYMNGYNWDSLIRSYIASVDADLIDEIESDPEAGMYVAVMPHSPANLNKMKRFEAHLRTMLADEAALMRYIEKNYDEIEWD